MYKIYINDKPLFLQDFSEYKLGDAFNLSGVYMDKPVTLLQYIDSLEKKNKLNAIRLYSKDVERLKNDFLGMYKVIDAAGGVVFNEKNEILVIFRRGSWDIAKGKIDKGETKEDAAVREVMEETGIIDVTLHEELGTTYHTYLSKKGKRILKRTFWYKMTAPNQDLIPQTEEDIEQAIWVNPETFISTYNPIYANIRDVLDKIF